MKTSIFIGFIFLLVPILSYISINNHSIDGENIEMDQLPMSQRSTFIDGIFIQNIGQEADDIDFTIRFHDYYVILGRSYMSINNYGIMHQGDKKLLESRVVTYNFINCNEVVPEGCLPRNYSYNFFIGNDSSKWFENVHLFEMVKYENIWDGIDIVFYSLNDVLKYDIIVHPYSDLDDINIQVFGQKSLIGEEDRLIMKFENDRNMVEGDLYCHYLNDNARIKAKYVMKDENTFSFQLDAFDPSRTIIIDPLISSTFIGGGSNEQSVKVLRDGEYIYIVGTTESIDFPTQPGSYSTEYKDDLDIFVSKFDSGLKNLIFSTFIGGFDQDRIFDFEFDENGNLLLSGDTGSSDFPITSDAFDSIKSNREVFLTKLSNNGSYLLYSTFIGGRGGDYKGYIDIDSKGNILIAGNTGSVDFPNTSYPYNPSNYTEAFLMKLDSTGKELIFSRTFGGATTIDDVNGMVIDSFDNIYLTGITASTDFPVTPDAFDRIHNGYSAGDWDIFFMKFHTNSSEIQYSSYFGGPGNEDNPSIVCDENECIYITGITVSYFDFPITEGCYDSVQDGYYDSFVFKYDFKIKSLIFSTYFGGGENDWKQYQDENSIFLDEEGCIYISGGAYSNEFPTTNNSYDTSYNSNRDVFLTKMSGNGSEIFYSTFIGGPFDDNSRDIYVDENKNVIITGFTDSNSFPTTNSYDPTHNGGQDVFLLILNLSVPPGRPVNLSGVAGNSFINITWERPFSDGNATIQGYEVFRRSPYEDFKLISTVNNSLFFNDMGLYNGTRYHYKVRAFNMAGSGIFSMIINATPMTIPTPPVDLTATGSDSSVELTWKSPFYSGGNPIWGYRLYRGVNSQEFDMISNFDNKTLSHLDGDVENGIQYYYYVTASNDAGESPPSKIVYSTPMRVPSAPTIIENQTGSDFIRIRWEVPEDDGGSEILGYRIYKGTKNGTEPFLISVGKDVEEYNDTSIQIGITFHYYVTAINEVGESPLSNRMAVILIVKPDQPGSFKATGFDGHVELSWSKPYSGGGSDIVSYNIYKGDGPDDLDILVSLNGGSLSFIDTNVENGQYYYYRISVVNERFESVLSDPIKAIPMGLASPSVIIGYDVGDNFIHLYWEEPDDHGGDPDISYVLYRQKNGSDPEEIGVFDKSVLDFNDTDVINGVDYRYYLRVKNLKGFSNPSNSIFATPLGLPSTVTDIRTTGGNGFILLQWALPDNDGGTNITGLIIFRSEDGEDFQVLKEIDLGSDIGVDDGDNDFYNDTSVINGIRYIYNIMVENVVGKSPSIKVDGMAKGVPQHPSNISVGADENKIFLNWTHPRNNGGSAVFKYMIYRSLNGDIFELVNIVSGDQNSWIDDDLENGNYIYRITAVSEFGESDPVESSSIEIDHSGQGNNLLKILLVIFALIIILLISIIVLFIFIRKVRSSGIDEENQTAEEEDTNDGHTNHGEDNISSVNE